MSKQEKSRKPLIIGIVAAVVILAALLGLLLTQCVGGGDATQSTPAQTVADLGEAEHYDLYWNLDRALYDGKSEAGLSSRKPESDGFFHVRFFKDGEIIELKVADRKTVNAMEVNDLMGLEFDSNGIIVGIVSLDDMPLQQVGWKFYVQSIGGNLLKLNSAKTFDGMELLCEMLDDTGLYDMTGAEGEVGKRITPIPTDRVIAIANLAGELTHVFIYERSEYMQTEEGECQHCKETVTWKLWNKTDTLPNDTGHYRLTDDIVLKTQCSIVEDGKVCLDLNGKVVDGPSNVRMYSLHNVGANLALMDTSEEQTGVMRGHTTSSPQGGIIWVRYGAFYMYGGTLDGSDMVSRLNGTVVQVPKGCYFYMYGGTIIGGTSKYTYDAETKKYGNGLGGALAVSGKFVMHDGEIRDGRAEAAVSAWNADGTPKTYQRGIGGNVYVGSGAEFEMKGGAIKNGVADHSGGNVYLDGTATMTMDGGTIAGGTVTGKGRNGGNVFVTSKATFTLNGGSINWGVSHNCAGNLYFNGTVNMNGGYIGCGVIRDWATGKVKPTDARTNVFQVGGSMTMFGGVIDGGYTVTDTSATDKTYTTLILGGMPVISGREELEYDDLVLTNGGSGVNVIVATMVPGSKIGVNATTGIFTKPTAEANKQYFYSNIDEANVEYVDGCLALGRWSCLCGSQEHFGKCDGTQLFWTPIPAPVNKTLPSAEGNYYLVKDITISTQGQVAENAHVNLDLYGHTLTGPNNHRTVGTFNPGSSLAITDTSEAKTGTIKTRGAGPTQGSAVWVRYGTFDLYGGTLDGSDYTLYANWNYGADKIYGTKDDKTEARDGGTVAMSTGTTFNMYGGTIIGAKAILHTGEKTVTEGEGENAVKKTVTRDLIASNGGALSISKNAVFNMYDGVIRDGHTDGKGGNIYMAGDGSTANLYGGVIENGDAGMRDENDKLVTYVGTDGKSKTKSAGWGANIDMNNKATVNLLGTIVMGGRSGGNGGNIRVGDTKATLNMSAGMVCDGQSTNDQGGNIFISGTANLTGGVVENGQARNGGNIGVNSSKVVTLNGTVVRGGVASGNGGNIRMSSTNKGGALVIAEGAVITGGKAYRGGNLCVEVNNTNKNDPESVLKITGGTIEKGLADGEFGGNIYMGSGAVMEMTGGLVDGGKAVNTGNGSYGGNLYNNGATVTISGGVLQNGQSGVMAEDGQTVVFGSNESTKKGWGGNISMKAGTLTISGDAQILGGKAGRNGGSIHAEGGTLNVAGGTISGGVSTADQGGNIWVGGSNTYLNVTGGTIKDGTTAKNGGNIHCNADVNVSLTGGYITGGSAYGSETYKNANVNLYAGENITIGSVKIDGYVLIASSVKLVDKPVIKGGTTNLSVNGFDVDVSGLDVGSDVHMIGITDSAAGIFSGEADLGEEAYFFSDDAEKVVGFVNGKLTLDKGRLGMGRYRCLCGKTPGYEGDHDLGCDGDTTRFWAAWTSTNSLPTENGNWYLTASQIKFSTQFALEKDAEVAIDLNGCTVIDSDNRMLSTSSANKTGNVTLWITDTSAGKAGKLVVTDANYADKGELLWLETGSTLNLLAGTLDAQAVNATTGGAILVAGNSTLKMYGGKIIGGGANTGGAVQVNGGSTFEMYGGIIEGGKAATSGDALYVDGNIKLCGGTINGEVDATKADTITVSGNIKLDAAETNLNLGENTLTVGELTSGASIGITADEGAFTAAGCTEADLAYFSSDIADMGVTYYNGQLHMGKLACLCGSPSANAADHKHYMDGDTLVGCDGTKVAWTPWTSTTTLPTSTGNFYLTAPVTLGGQASLAKNADVVLDLNGYKVTPAQKDGKDASMRMISLHNEGARFTLTDSYVVPAADSADYDANRTGGEIIGSATRSDVGLVVWLRDYDKGTVFVMLGGRLTGGTGSVNNSDGGVVSVSNNATFYMLDGTISNGTAKNGGNVNVDTTGRMVMTGGEIKDGHAPNGSAIRAFGAVELRGGKVEDTVLMLNWNQSSASITLSGDADVEHIYLNKGKNKDDVDLATIVVPSIVIEGELTGTTVTKITTHNTLDHYIATTTVEANAARFSTDYAGKAIHYIDGKLYLGKYNCLCGGNGNTDTANGGTCVGATEGCDSQLRIWTATASLPNISGNYYLSKNVTLTTNGPTITAASDIALDLNGYNITMQMTATCGGRLYSTNGSGANAISFLFTNTYSGTDAARTGKIIFDDTKVTTDPGGDQGRVVWFTGSGKRVKIYNVGIDMAKATVRKGVKQNGMVFSANSDNAAARASLELYNVSIVGGTARSSLVGVGANADAVFHDVSITGHTGAEDYSGLNISDATANAVFSGTTYVTGNKLSDGTTASNIRLVNGGVLNLAEDYTGTAGQISGITAHLSTGNAPRDVVFGTNLTYAVKDLFVTDDDKVLGFSDGKLTVYAAGSHVHCVCGGTMTDGQVLADGTIHKCQDIIFTPISGDIKGQQIENVTANWYLEDDVQILDKHYQMKDSHLNLCLNGHNWKGAANARAISFQNGSNSLSLTTCKADVLDADGIPTNNRIVASGAGAQGFGVWVRRGTFNMYAGNIDGRAYEGSSGSLIDVTNNGDVSSVMNMYGGSVFGGHTKASGTNRGGNIRVTGTGTLNILGGKIYNGNANSGGGNLYIESTGVVNMYGGLITDGMTNGVLLHESANVLMHNTAKLNISGGEITGCISGLDDTTVATVAVSGSAKLTNPSNGYYRLMITSGATAGVPRVKLVIGALADDAIVRVTVLKEGDKPFLGQFAEAAEGYTMTESDAGKVTIWWNGGKTISDKYGMVFRDNGLWVQAK